MKIRELFLFLFYDVHKENMFTINLEDGRYKASFDKIDLKIWVLEVGIPF